MSKCRQGHEFTPENTIVRTRTRNGKTRLERSCRQCKYATNTKHNRMKRIKAAHQRMGLPL
jgi:hypothetical protein